MRSRTNRPYQLQRYPIPFTHIFDGWMDKAKCRNTPDNFFPNLSTRSLRNNNTNGTEEWYQEKVIPLQIKYCNKCPVAQQCLEYGLDTGSEGIWGGQLLLGRAFRSRSYPAIFNPKGNLTFDQYMQHRKRKRRVG